jgi:hypothetical protein
MNNCRIKSTNLPNQHIMKNDSREMVDHPQHYQSDGGIEAIDVIESFKLGFNLGNAIKYILRSDSKGNKKQDLEKALWYISREHSKFNG